MKFTAAAALLAATTLTLPASQAQADPTSYHIMRPQGKLAHLQHPPKAATVVYFGGPVVSTVNVVAVLWGSKLPAATKTNIGPFLQSIVNSTFVDQLAQYSTVGITGTNGDPGTGQTITRGTYGGLVTITPANKSTTLTDKAITTELQAQIAAGKLPAANLNTLYMIYFPASITITIDGATSCIDFGAYHESVSATNVPTNIFYGVMPACGGFSSITVASSHEFAEAVTDPLPTPGSHPAYPQAWNDATGDEIADLCEGSNTTLVTKAKTYSIQEVYNNSKNACATGKFTSP
jgi:hypothetical protein